MNARAAIILVVLLAVLGGGALLYQQQERTRRPQNVDTLGRVLLKDLKAADIAAIRVVEAKATLTVQRKGERWVIAERGDFPADQAKVREFVLKAIGLKVGQSEPLGEKDRARLNLDDSGARVEFNDAGGKTLGALIVGRKYFKREVDNPGKTPADGRFVALPGETGTAFLVGDALAQATTRTADWIDRTSFQVEKVKTLEVRYPGGDDWRIERAADNADWRLVGARPGEKLDTPKANAASYSLQLLELADVAPKEAATDTKMSGLDQPVAIDATTLDGASYAIKVGKLAGDNHYVSFTASGVKPEAKGAEQAKLLSQYVLLIPKSKLEDTLKKRSELLESKDQKK
ncbi:MAG: hypothetical protein K0R40_828 [Burkholderiales bacterium]|jgi:hypothetical protein|nr:hypothetical protein [Burkholderiales bacterium]